MPQPDWDERSSPSEAETLLYDLANAFFPTNQGFSIHPAVPGARMRESQLGRGEALEGDGDASERESSLLAVDALGIVQSATSAASAMFGVPASDLLGAALSRCFVGPPPTATERAVGVRRDGSQFELLVTVLPLAGSELTLFALRDLSEAHARALASKRAEARYRTLVEQIPAVTFMASLEESDNELYIGPQIESLLGYTQKEWLDDPVLWFHRMHPDDQDRWNAEFARGCEVGGPFRADCRFFARDGRTVWVHGEARVVRDPDGHPLFIQGIAFDITDIKDAEERLRQAQEALVRNEKLAAIGQLASSVGHELRNPLAAIRNAWFYLQRRLIHGSEAETDPRVMQFSGVISAEIDRCAKIIGELLDFSRERAIHRVPMPARELAQAAIELVIKPAASIELVNDVPEDLPTPNLDVDQFRQVLVNLLQNAAEAVNPGNGRILVQASATADELTLVIRDNGRGMSGSVREKIFEPLYTTKLRGTGLGLAIALGVVKRHGGQISVASELARGTTFSITVPIGEASSDPLPELGGAADLRHRPDPAVNSG